jgi:hypothetical protein
MYFKNVTIMTLSEFLEDFPSVTNAEAIATIEEARTGLTATLK